MSERYMVLAVLIEDSNTAYEMVTSEADTVETVGEDLTYEEALELVAQAGEIMKNSR